MSGNSPSDAMSDQATHWMVALRDPAFDGWDAFTDWLAEDPAHAVAYDRAVALDAEVGSWFEAAPQARVQPLLASPRPRGHRWRWAGGAIAAALVAVVGGKMVVDRLPAPYAVETVPGARQALAFADGTRIELNGGTRLLLDRHAVRSVTLQRGEAVFHVVHDASDPFTVKVGDTSVVDVGTVFDVQRRADATAVAVAEGAVVYDPDSGNVRMQAGDALEAPDRGDAVVRKVATDSVGSWRVGRLTYASASLDRIADDLQRNLGERVRVSPSARAQRFTGTLALHGGASRVLPRIAPLLGVRASHSSEGWMLSSQDRARP
jgi:transmembrane sensor